MYFGSRGFSLSQLGRCGRKNSSHSSDQARERARERERELMRGEFSLYSTWGPSPGHMLPKLGQVCASLPRGRNTLRHTQRCALTTTQVFLKLPQLTRVNLTVTNRPVTCMQSANPGQRVDLRPRQE